MELTPFPLQSYGFTVFAVKNGRALRLPMMTGRGQTTSVHAWWVITSIFSEGLQYKKRLFLLNSTVQS
jgi:hypothetical protein